MVNTTLLAVEVVYMDLDLTKPLVLKSKQVKSFKTAPQRWRGDGLLSVSAQAARERSKQSRVKGL